MSGILDFYVLSCLFLAVKTDQILQPQNVSVVWIHDFQPQLSWAPYQGSMKNCTYEVITENEDQSSLTLMSLQHPPWKGYKEMQGRFLSFTVTTVCSNNKSEPVVINITYPELVKDPHCYIYSSTQSHCSWIPASNASNLTFFYILTDENFEVVANSQLNLTITPLRECSSYTFTNDVRTGCDLQSNVHQAIHTVFNAMVDNKPARNTFKIQALNVSPPAPHLKIIDTGDTLKMNWSAPDILPPSSWKFLLKVTKCNEALVHESDRTSYELHIDPSCQYCVAIKAVTKVERGETTWSNSTCFGTNKAPKALYAFLIIPLLLSGLAALMLVCCIKYKKDIFPEVPEPRDLVSDIADNNNKSTVCNFYVPEEEEQSCKITLVLDPENNKP
ncbi:cytokine receptor common subunit gamma-like [Morone saxatilis]|uniref:cytokine receptor common subunit gamma-like n=1 Tax=Morone saxatilis TaxID=34816 RepID=UPI0015E23479|nr:cytokine receptor common subunit gamma-like [Morone saxatilis]